MKGTLKMIQHTKTYASIFMLTTLVLLMFAGYAIHPAHALTNKALGLDGSDDYVQVAGVYYGQLDEYTVELWFKTGSNFSGRSGLFVASKSSTRQGIIIQLESAGTLRALHHWNWETTGGRDQTTTSTYDDGQWHHVAVVRDTSGNWYVYIDGGVALSDTNASQHADVTMNFFIGQSGNNGNYFNGQIDEVRFWTVARTSTDILDSYNSGSPTRLIGNETGLSGYWNFDTSTSGADLQLNSTQQYDGSLINGAYVATSDLTFDSPEYSNIPITLTSHSLFSLNSAINIGETESVTLTVNVDDSDSLVDGVARVLWTDVTTDTSPPSDAADFGNTTTSSHNWTYSNFTNTGALHVYLKAVVTLTNNLEAESPVEDIKIYRWYPPTVEGNPPDADIPTLAADDTDGNGAFSASELSDNDKASWLNSKYVTVLGDTVRLKADGSPAEGNSDPNNNEQIGMYRWDTDDGEEFQQLAMTTFDGVDDVVVIKDYKGITGSDSRTVAAWINTSQATDQTIVYWGTDQTGQRWQLFVRSSGELRVEILGSGSVDSNTNVADGTDKHIAVVFDGTTATLYINGVNDNSANLSSTNTVAGVDVVIGSNYDTRYFNGKITEVAIWSRALSETEILEHFNNGMTDALRTNLEEHLAETVEFTPSTATTNGTLTATAVTNYGIESAGVDFTLKVYDLLNLDTSVTTEGNTADLAGEVSNLDDYGTNATTTYQWQVNTEPGLTFDGVDDYVLIPNNTSNINASFTDRTVSLWFKTDNLTQTKAIIHEQGGASNGLSVYLDAGVLYVGGWTNISGGLEEQWLSTSITSNQWYHVAWVLNSASSQLEFWLDGAQISTAAGLTSGIGGATDGNGIGALYGGSRTHSTGTKNYFQGQIDDIATFDSALDSADILELSGTLPELTSVFSTSPPIGHWKLDDSAGTTATDSSGTNDGTLQNGLTWLTTLTSATPDDASEATYTWTGSRDAVYLAEFSATAASDELREIPKATEVTSVTITAGSPIATTGGPYTGGIIGGDFSPIQFEGNAEGATEFDTLGTSVTIAEWQWTFDKTVTYNQGLIFASGVDDFVDLGSPTIITNSGLTLSAWMDPDANDSKLISEDTGNVILGLDANGAPYFTITTDVATYTATAPNAVDAAYWHHVIGVYDGTQIKLYVDGFLQTAEEADADGIVASTGTVTTTGQMKIGDGFTGRIDAVSIWEDALSEAEREALRLGSLLNTGGLFGYWAFDEGSGTTAGNVTGSNNGTLTNFPSDNSGWVESTIEKTEDSTSTTDPLAVWNPTQTYDKAGEYSASLRVRAVETGRWSTTEETTVTIVDGSIAGKINAADLRTPVDGVRLTLTSAHVLNGDLSSLVATRPNLGADDEGSVATTTGTDGTYRFTNLPLGNYRIVATKTDAVDLDGDGTLDTVIHEFETPAQVTTLTTSLPEQPAIDFVDLSVFPVGGKIRALPWDLADTDAGEQPDEPNDNLTALLIDDVVIEAKPLGGTSSVESDPSDSTADATGRNYSLPMFAGRYQFFARLGERDIRLDENVPHETLYTVADDPATTDVDESDTSAVRIVTINGATAGINFIDHTMYTLTLTVEDSGGNPIEKLADIPAGDTLDIPIEVDATLSGGAPTATKPVVVSAVDGTTSITYELPPGQYTLQPGQQDGNPSFAGQGIVFENPNNPDELLSTLTVDLTAGDETAKMVVPVKIKLAIGPGPNLMDVFDTNGDGIIDPSDDFYTLLTNQPDDDPPGFGLSPTDITVLESGLQDYMYYDSASLQTHIYAIKATANGHPVKDFNLFVEDEISLLADGDATEQNIEVATLFEADLTDVPTDEDSDGTLDVPTTLSTAFSDADVTLSDETVSVVDFDNDGSTDSWLIINGDGSIYYVQQIDADGDGTDDTLHVNQGSYTIVGGLPKTDGQSTPSVVAKTIAFTAKKDRYTDSDEVSAGVKVLGDRLQGTAAQIVSIPNVNYLVLHDPPGDNSYAYLEDDITLKGIVSGMTIKAKDKDIRVYPAPWTEDRDGIGGGSDLGKKGLLGTRTRGNAFGSFSAAAAIETVTGVPAVFFGPGLAYPVQLLKAFVAVPSLTSEDWGLVQYEVSAGRRLETPSDDTLPDLMGPGRGDIYFGEGWTLGLQQRYRFGLSYDGTDWNTTVNDIWTYDILDRENQYIYTTRDIENIIDNLDASTKAKVTDGRDTWKDLLKKNKAYKWSHFYVDNAAKVQALKDKHGIADLSTTPSELNTLETFYFEGVRDAETAIANESGDAFEAFRKAEGLPKDNSRAGGVVGVKVKNKDVETLIFSAGPAFEYSRTISEGRMATFTSSVEFETSVEFANSAFKSEITGIGFEMSTGIQSEQGLSGSWQSGVGTEQTVGFVLQDDDVGDNIATRVYKDPEWGTPLFIHDLGSVTSDPWEPGTNKAVDITLTQMPTQLGFLFGVALADTAAKDAAVAAFDSNANTIPSDDITDGADLEAAFITNGLATDSDEDGSADETINVAIEVADSRWSVTVTPATGSASEYLVRVETTSSGTWALNVYEETTSTGPFDYHAGAHYRVKVTFTGLRELENKGMWLADFLLYSASMSNKDNATVSFNSEDGRYKSFRFGLTENDPSSTMVVSIYPPEVDMDNSYEKEYSVVIVAEEAADSQIGASLTLNPRFADLSPPKTQITSPHEGQRISPAMFGFDGDSGTAVDLADAFTIQVVSDAPDIDSIQIQSRTKLQNGVWSTWTQLGDTNGSVVTWSEVNTFTYLGGEPMQRQYSFQWHGDDINDRGVGEYQFRALAFDKAGNPTGTPPPSDLPNAPAVTVIVDANEPTVLTTIPNYQDKESERIYYGELSVTFTDDMREHDFTPVVSSSDNAGTFEVIDLLDSDELTRYVSGFVSYSPSLRKAMFVPQVPFQANGFYKVTIRTDDSTTGVSGVHDLAGNPLDQEFSWTFRTTDTPFEETWSITLSAETTNLAAETVIDGGNIAGVEKDALDMTIADDEKDARGVPSLSSQLRLTFLDTDLVEYERDMRPPDGRISHHWFFVIDRGDNSTTNDVTIRWKPSISLTQATTHYPVLRLLEFQSDFTTVNQVIQLDASQGTLDPVTGEIQEMVALTYTPASGERSRYFRLDVRKTGDFAAEDFIAGTSRWLFLSVPIIPQVADPYVNFGDDFNLFQLYDYDTALGGYYVYPHDLDRSFGITPGRAYFTRFDSDTSTVQVDVGGATNFGGVDPDNSSRNIYQLTLSDAGWHPIGNPYNADVLVSALEVNGFSFPGASNEVESTLYQWVLGTGGSFKTAANGSTTVTSLDGGTLPQTLIDEMNDNFLATVSTSAMVTVVSSGEEWTVDENSITYTITYNDVLFKVDQDADHYAAVTSGDSLQPWQGYWLKTNEDDVELTFPAPANITYNFNQLPSDFLPPLAPPLANSSSPLNDGKQLSLRLQLKSNFASDLITEFGTHSAALIGKDVYDASEPPKLGQTVSAYFRHPEWGADAGIYNTDYQPVMESGDTRTWEFVVFTDKTKADMTLSWASAIRNIPDDVMLYFRRLDEREGGSERILPPQSEIQNQEWQDMRKVQSVDLKSSGRITEIPFEVRAERYSMSPPAELQVITGEAQVEIRWKAEENPFIDSYALRKQVQGTEAWKTIPLQSSDGTVSKYIDTDVEEEMTYTYQVAVHFLSGAELRSELVTTTVLPVIKETVLLQNYPNPFNPETWLPYDLAKDADVSIKIYEVDGHLVRTIDLGFQSRGHYINRSKAAYWDGRNKYGERVASGIYFYLMRSGDYAATRKMVILK